jgi:DNA-binding transcriptional LysR family regulator
MSIEVRLLRAFVTTVDEGSVNRAATVLHITQPALSRQVKQLEVEVGVPLFVRTGRAMRLTRAGDEFLTTAREMLSHAESLQRTAASIAAGRLESVHLAVPTTTLTDVLAPFLATLTPADPVPRIRETDPKSAVAALLGGADLVISTTAPPGRLGSLHIATLPVWAYVTPGDHWSRSSQVKLTDLVARRLILLTGTFRPRQLLDAATTTQGLTYGEVIECGNAQVAQALAASGRGVAVVSDDPRFGLTPVCIQTANGPLSIDLYAAWERGHHAADRLSQLAKRLATFCADRYGRLLD